MPCTRNAPLGVTCCRNSVLLEACLGNVCVGTTACTRGLARWLAAASWQSLANRCSGITGRTALPQIDQSTCFLHKADQTPVSSAQKQSSKRIDTRHVADAAKTSSPALGQTTAHTAEKVSDTGNRHLLVRAACKNLYCIQCCTLT